MGYTKAPWTFDLDDMEIRGQYGRIVELAPRMDAIHNGRLISSAPDLLLAVKCLCEEMADYMKINHLGDPNDKHNYRLGMAAIHKAENG